MRFSQMLIGAAAALALIAAQPTSAADENNGGGSTAADNATNARNNDKGDTFNPDEITHAASDFFGLTTEAAAKAVQHVFKDQGQPDAYIKGDEGGGAFVVGLRYGEGWLVRKHFEPVKVYWKGPSVGFDVGGNASKFFALVYNLKRENRLYQRFPSAEGSYYFIAGIGVNYLRSGGVTVAPMRTGVGLRAGVNAGYLVFSQERDWFPF